MSVHFASDCSTSVGVRLPKTPYPELKPVFGAEPRANAQLSTILEESEEEVKIICKLIVAAIDIPNDASHAVAKDRQLSIAEKPFEDRWVASTKEYRLKGTDIWISEDTVMRVGKE